MNDMTDAAPAANPVAVFRAQLSSMEDQFRAALPAHIPVERFARVVMTAVQQTPELLRCERRSLWNAAVKAAQDGLLPDGREGAMVIYKDKQRGEIVQWMPMIAGIRKKARNSGEIATWDVYVVHANDEFDYELGDAPFIRHKPTLDDPGPVIAAYSVATLKSGEKSREVMSVSAIEKVRAVSRAKDNKFGPWVNWYEEMCRKTVARRHSKVLPMSTDLDDLVRRDDDLYDFAGAREEAARPRSLGSKLDLLAAPPATGEEPAGEDNDPAAAESEPVAAEPEHAAEPDDGAESYLVERMEAEAAAPAPEPPRGITGEERQKLTLFAQALASVLTPASVSKGAGRFYTDNRLVEGSPMEVAAMAIAAAHTARTRGEMSPAEADEAVRRALAS